MEGTQLSVHGTLCSKMQSFVLVGFMADGSEVKLIKTQGAHASLDVAAERILDTIALEDDVVYHAILASDPAAADLE